MMQDLRDVEQSKLALQHQLAALQDKLNTTKVCHPPACPLLLPLYDMVSSLFQITCRGFLQAEPGLYIINNYRQC